MWHNSKLVKTAFKQRRIGHSPAVLAGYTYETAYEGNTENNEEIQP